MQAKIKRKTWLMIAIEIFSILFLIVFLLAMQTRLAVNNKASDIQEELAQMEPLITAADETAQQSTDSYDEVYQAKASSLAYMAQHLDSFSYNNIEEYRQLLNATNILILDKQGNILSQAVESPADFTSSRFNQLRTVFTSDDNPAAFEIDYEDQIFRYYGAKIDDDTMAVVEQDPEELHEILDDTSTWHSILENVSVGLHGYAFAVSDKDYSFLYHPDENLVGEDALAAGLTASQLGADYTGWVEVNGERLYCGVTHLDEAYIVCAIPNSEIISSRNTTVTVVVFIFFIVMTLVITYAILLLKEDAKKEDLEIGTFQTFGHFRYNRIIGKNISTIIIIGLIAIFLVSFYMQSLFSLSRQSMSNEQRVQEVDSTIDLYADDAQLLTEQYNRRYLNKARAAAYILQQNPDLIDKEALIELRDVLNVENVGVFDDTGTMVSHSGSYSKFHLSDNPEDQSYEFNKLLNGAEYVIQDAQNDELSGQYRQYIGVSMVDDTQTSVGFVQISVVPDRQEEALASTSITSILNSVKVGVGGFAFAVDKDDNTFAYYPKEKVIGRKATNYGLEKSQLTDNYSGFIELNNTRYYASSLETSDYYVYVVIPESEVGEECITIAVISTAISLLFLLFVFLLLTISRVPATKVVTEEDREFDILDDDISAEEALLNASTSEAGNTNASASAAVSPEAAAPVKHSSGNIDIKMPDGRIKHTESAVNRWSNISVHWFEKTPEQKVFTLLKLLIGIFAAIICGALIFRDQIFDSTSIFLYILQGRWERGFNIFAVTASLLIICVVTVATMLVRKLLQLLSQTLDARGETICRLLSSFLRYISVIGELYYCLALFGVNTATLVASAGILSLVVGLGANSLISDILAGLFLIFEGEFRVGDIVTVGDWRGTVMEIGVRTTKIQDPSNNIKIISNRDVTGIINMTRRYSFAFCDVGIEYSESLEHVESVLSKELPRIKRHLPAIKEGPFYKGVVSLGDSSVVIRIMVECEEGDRIQLTRDLNREVKLIFDKHDIGIPFPQIVLNQPTIKREATFQEKYESYKFHKEQTELTKDMIEDEDR